MNADQLARIHAAIAELDNRLFDAGLAPTDQEQRDCLLDPQRLDEAGGMLDDFIARLGMPVFLINRLKDLIQEAHQ